MRGRINRVKGEGKGGTKRWIQREMEDGWREGEMDRGKGGGTSGERNEIIWISLPHCVARPSQRRGQSFFVLWVLHRALHRSGCAAGAQ